MKASIRLGAIATCAFVLLSASSARAEWVFKAIIENEQEVSAPPVPEQGSGGEGWFVLNNAQTALSYHVTLTGLDIDGLQTPGDANDNANRFHIHAGPAGTNGGIVMGMKDPNHDLDDLVINPAAGTIDGVWDGIEGNGTTLAAQLANLHAGNLYFNVHTTDHPGGEVRGQILLVPEPSSTVVAGAAIASLLALRRRRA